MSVIDIQKAKMALPKIEIGLNKYLNIMKQFHQVDVSKDKQFQQLFNGFYKIRQRSPKFYDAYYFFMEANKNQDIDFVKTLAYFHTLFGSIERSFSSKLVATINPEKPVWDQYVMKNIGIKIPNYSTKDRLNKTIYAYERLELWYKDFLGNDDSKNIIKMFDEKFPHTEITDLKKIDLILWQSR